MLDAIPEGSSWQIVSIGKHQLPLSTMAVAMGGNIRVGMEDNVYYGHGELAESNAQRGCLRSSIQVRLMLPHWGMEHIIRRYELLFSVAKRSSPGACMENICSASMTAKS